MNLIRNDNTLVKYSTLSPFIGDLNVSHIPCLAHILNLIVKEGLRVTDPILHKVLRQVIIKIRRGSQKIRKI
ncbi:hypothetical protein O9G_001882 [Rozella allomycis CSF55]|uniref:Uncharacterized protein n=1 Tax=Rozella allomycis (strain CSF55) TaxID=988480 RepID=A0A069C7W8_ROZAC|nr:hypothetical protein O9G_001881 [Rozella allomycis CSF55]EPZ34581.1 hypothetical protein O9G_001882 [Rozella allomycis CSF55]|eukprot:EPZ34580.1 hypothetical protein O9G_001881 [Rozella allomycis CSF55]